MGNLSLISMPINFCELENSTLANRIRMLFETSFILNPSQIIVLSAQDKLSTSRKRAAQQGLEVTLIARGSGGEYMSVDDMKKLMSRDLVLFQERTG